MLSELNIDNFCIVFKEVYDEKLRKYIKKFTIKMLFVPYKELIQNFLEKKDFPEFFYIELFRNFITKMSKKY